MIKLKLKNLAFLWLYLTLIGITMSFITDWRFVPPMITWGGLLALSIAYLIIPPEKDRY